MSAPAKPRRLARAWRLVGPARWYLEQDHLLLADQHWWTVDYRRFYYSDIQSVTVWPRPRPIWRFAGAPALAALFTWPAAVLFLLVARHGFRAWPHVGWVAAGEAGLVAAAVGLLEALAGPFVHTRIVTRYSRFETPLVHRWRRAERALRVLAPLLAATQSAEQESAGPRGTTPEPTPTVAAEPAAPGSMPAQMTGTELPARTVEAAGR